MIYFENIIAILLEDCAVKQRKIKLKFKENQKIT